MKLAAVPNPSAQALDANQRGPLHVGLRDKNIYIDTAQLNSTQIEHLLKEVQAQVSRIERLFGLGDDAALVIHDDRGVPYLKPGSPVTVISMTDCHDTETYARMAARFAGNLPSNLSFNGGTLPVDNFATLHLGAAVASFVGERLSLDPEKQTPVILLGNAAPRPGNDPDSVGTRFVLAQLPGNVFYLGTLDGALSLVKEGIVDQNLFELNIEHANATTVFRSRFLPEIAAAWVLGERGAIREEIEIDLVKPLENSSLILSVDNFGNIKTGLTSKDLEDQGLKHGDMLEISINDGPPIVVKYGKGLGDVPEGELVLAQGSTNHGLNGKPVNRLDIYCNNNNAAKRFGLYDIPNSPVGAKIVIERADTATQES